MRKVLIFLSILFLVVACSSNKDSESDKAAEVSQVTFQAPLEVAEREFAAGEAMPQSAVAAPTNAPPQDMFF